MTRVSSPAEIEEFLDGRRDLVVLSEGQATGRSIRNYDPEFLLRPFAVTVEGFGTFTFHAPTRARAMADAWNAYVGAGYDMPYAGFMKIAQVRSTVPGERFGEPILVGGRRAFYVSWDSHYVQFASPGATRYGNSHPLDVTSVTGEPFAR